jgi:hypothetical protein
MKKKTLNKEAKGKDNIKKSIVNGKIAEFVNENETKIELFGDTDNKTPIMTRIDGLSLALLDHLANRWKKTRSGLACELLETMIIATFRELHKDKTEEQINNLYIQAVLEFNERQKFMKGEI